MQYRIIRSRRRTIALEITDSGGVIVRAPYRMPETEISAFVVKHERWIKEKSALQAARNYRNMQAEQNSDYYIKKARQYIPQRVEFFSRMMEIVPSSIRITSAKTRFGSCSGKNAVCFSWRLMTYPNDAIDYVIVHELAHIKHHNHSREFYALVEKYLPDYKLRQKSLKEIDA